MGNRPLYLLSPPPHPYGPGPTLGLHSLPPPVQESERQALAPAGFRTDDFPTTSGPPLLSLTPHRTPPQEVCLPVQGSPEVQLE